MKLGIVMPVVLQNDIMLTTTLDAAEKLTTKHDATLYVVCNRLHVCSPDVLQRNLAQRFRGSVVVLHEAGVERSVAGAWNFGCMHALNASSDYIAIAANDTSLNPDCLDLLLEYGESASADVWSGISYNNRENIDLDAIGIGADFSCFMIRPLTLHRFGMFDPNFRPAYFEDNDYYARVILGGGSCHVVHRAQFFHHGSMTVRSDPDMAHHVQYWFETNRQYFARKWGVASPHNDNESIRSHYYGHPFNDASKPLSWFPGEYY